MDRPAGTDGLAGALGWFSVALGAAQLLAPDAVTDLVGLERDPRTRGAMRLVGTQELLVGAGLLRRSQTSPWLWSRVAGDLSHLAALASARRSGEHDEQRLERALAAVAAVGLVDLLAAVRASRGGDRDRTVAFRTSTTINRAPDEVYARWRDLERLPSFMVHLRSVEDLGGGRSRWVAHGPAGTSVAWTAEITRDVHGEEIAWRAVDGARLAPSGRIAFTPAPGGQGTEVVLELEVRVPGGDAAATVAELFGEHPEQQAKDALRRFKQVVETGGVVRSDATPDGTRTGRQLRQPPAQPARRGARGRSATASTGG